MKRKVRQTGTEPAGPPALLESEPRRCGRPTPHLPSRVPLLRSGPWPPFLRPQHPPGLRLVRALPARTEVTRGRALEA